MNEQNNNNNNKEVFRDENGNFYELVGGQPMKLDQEEGRKRQEALNSEEMIDDEYEEKRQEAQMPKKRGRGIYKRTEETKQKMSEVKKGENHPLFGKHHTEEAKQKMSEALKGENNPMFGKHHTEETRMKMSEARKGKYHPTEETKKKISEARKGMTYSKIKEIDGWLVVKDMKNQVLDGKSCEKDFYKNRNLHGLGNLEPIVLE